MVHEIEKFSERDEKGMREAKTAFIEALEDSKTRFMAGEGGVYLAYRSGFKVRLAPNYKNGTVLADSCLGVRLREETLVESRAYAAYASAYKFKFCDLYSSSDDDGMSLDSYDWKAGESVHFRMVVPIEGPLGPDDLVGYASIGASSVKDALLPVVQGSASASHRKERAAHDVDAAHKAFEALLASILDDND